MEICLIVVELQRFRVDQNPMHLHWNFGRVCRPAKMGVIIKPWKDPLVSDKPQAIPAIIHPGLLNRQKMKQPLSLLRSVFFTGINFGLEMHDKTMVEKRDNESKTPKKDENRTYETLIMFLCSVMGMGREDRATRKGSQVKSPPNLITM